MIEESKAIHTLLITFDFNIRGEEVSRWRGAFVEMAGWDEDILHNHEEGGECKYRYPLIQYRAIRGKAVIFAMGEALPIIQEILTRESLAIRWAEKEYSLPILDIRLDEYFLREIFTPKTYTLHRWLPLHGKRYKKWLEMDNLVDRVLLLEETLKKQLATFCKQYGFDIENKLETRLQNILRTEQVYAFQTPMIMFTIEYSANILLPENIGIGRAISRGFGWQTTTKKRNK